MARIVYSALVDSIKGSIKGTTFQSNRYGYTIKSKPNLSNPNTSRQSVQKIRFGQYTQAWRILSVSNRDNWNTYATNFPVPSKHNPAAFLNGFSVFTRYHGFRSKSSLSILENPSAAQGSVQYFSPELFLSGGDLILFLDIGTVTGDWIANISLTRPLGPTQNSLKGYLKFISIITKMNFPNDNDLTSAYQEIYGFIPNIGDRVGIRVSFWNEGNGQVLVQPNTIVTVGT